MCLSLLGNRGTPGSGIRDPASGGSPGIPRPRFPATAARPSRFAQPGDPPQDPPGGPRGNPNPPQQQPPRDPPQYSGRGPAREAPRPVSSPGLDCYHELSWAVRPWIPGHRSIERIVIVLRLSTRSFEGWVGENTQVVAQKVFGSLVRPCYWPRAETLCC